MGSQSQNISRPRLILNIILRILLLPHYSLQTDENKLLLHLLRDYSPFARPVLNSSTPVKVTFGFELVHIVSVVESEQTINQKVWLRMSWRNEFLTWSPHLWGGVTETRVNMDHVWTPDIFLQVKILPFFHRAQIT